MIKAGPVIVKMENRKLFDWLQSNPKPNPTEFLLIECEGKRAWWSFDKDALRRE